MDVAVISAEGAAAEPGSLVSIRAGGARRQGAVKTGQSFYFPVKVQDASPFKVNVLRQVGVGEVVDLSRDGIFDVPLTHVGAGDSGEAPRDPVIVKLRVTSNPKLCGRPRSELKPPTDIAQREDADGQTKALDDSGAADASALMPPSKGGYLSEGQHGHTRQYFDDHNIMRVTQSLLEALVREQPDDPYEYIAAFMERLSGVGAIAAADAERGAAAAVVREPQQPLGDAADTSPAGTREIQPTQFRDPPPALPLDQQQAQREAQPQDHGDRALPPGTAELEEASPEGRDDEVRRLLKQTFIAGAEDGRLEDIYKELFEERQREEVCAAPAASTAPPAFGREALPLHALATAPAARTWQDGWEARSAASAGAPDLAAHTQVPTPRVEAASRDLPLGQVPSPPLRPAPGQRRPAPTLRKLPSAVEAQEGCVWRLVDPSDALGAAATWPTADSAGGKSPATTRQLPPLQLPASGSRATQPSGGVGLAAKSGTAPAAVPQSARELLASRSAPGACRALSAGSGAGAVAPHSARGVKDRSAALGAIAPRAPPMSGADPVPPGAGSVGQPRLAHNSAGPMSSAGALPSAKGLAFAPRPMDARDLHLYDLHSRIDVIVARQLATDGETRAKLDEISRRLDHFGQRLDVGQGQFPAAAERTIVLGQRGAIGEAGSMRRLA